MRDRLTNIHSFSLVLYLDFVAITTENAKIWIWYSQNGMLLNNSVDKYVCCIDAVCMCVF